MVNAFSFCLYGPPNPRYYDGLLENIVLIYRHFPAWVFYVYIGADVPDGFVQILQSCSGIRVRMTGITGPRNMIHRFYAIDEPDVDVMFVRDADSRIHWKDRWAIHDFLDRPEYLVHTIRDNVVHTAKMMGGLWAIRKSAGLNIHEEYEQFKNNVVNHGHAHDQDFLTERIYSKLKSKLLVHKCEQVISFPDEHVKVFPFTWINDIYCGRIESNFVDILPEHETNPRKKPLYYLRTAITPIKL